MSIVLKKVAASFHLRKSVIHAVRGVSFTVNNKEILGIVGESGSGKSVLALSLLQLIPRPPATISGEALLDNVNLLNCDQPRIRSIRGKRISMIFQDPLSAFNPFMRLSDQIIEPLIYHDHVSRKEALEFAVDLLIQTGITDAQRKINTYPHQFSGGMLQRAMIAMALITKPAFLIADEPTTALDVTTQVQILELLKMFQQQFSMSILFITHNLGVAATFCDRINVMYAGTILESGTTKEVFKHTAHPYTKALIRCVPSLDDASDSLQMINGTLFDPSQPLTGCPFAARCDYTDEYCRSFPCTLDEVTPGHASACIRVKKGEISL
jgi:oligopeptide transport system ATP-binding protein